ncbi:MAG TPA: hypothetical protein VF345_09030 [Chthoniobacterales bacterium]
MTIETRAESRVRTFGTAFVCALALSSGSGSVHAAEKRPQSLPLNFNNSVAFFKETLGKQPPEVHKRCVVFYEGEWATRTRYRHSVITVEESDEDLAITFCITDDRGADWINRFVRGPFFTVAETNELSGMLAHHDHRQSGQVGRFDVEVAHIVARRTEVVVLSFQTAGKPPL